MPLYWDEMLRNKVSPELKKRMQGLSVLQLQRAGSGFVSRTGEVDDGGPSFVSTQESVVTPVEERKGPLFCRRSHRAASATLRPRISCVVACAGKLPELFREGELL